MVLISDVTFPAEHRSIICGLCGAFPSSSPRWVFHHPFLAVLTSNISVRKNDHRRCVGPFFLNVGCTKLCGGSFTELDPETGVLLGSRTEPTSSLSYGTSCKGPGHTAHRSPLLRWGLHLTAVLPWAQVMYSSPRAKPGFQNPSLNLLWTHPPNSFFTQSCTLL